MTFDRVPPEFYQTWYLPQWEFEYIAMPYLLILLFTPSLNPTVTSAWLHLQLQLKFQPCITIDCRKNLCPNKIYGSQQVSTHVRVENFDELLKTIRYASCTCKENFNSQQVLKTEHQTLSRFIRQQLNIQTLFWAYVTVQLGLPIRKFQLESLARIKTQIINPMNRKAYKNSIAAHFQWSIHFALHSVIIQPQKIK